MQRLPIRVQDSNWLEKNFRSVTHLLKFFSWWVFRIEGNKLSIFTPYPDVMDFYWENKLYLQDLTLIKTPEKIRIWSIPSEYSPSDPLLSVLAKRYNISEGVTVSQNRDSVCYALSGTTKSAPHCFYGTMLNQSFVLKSFLLTLLQKGRFMFEDRSCKSIRLDELLGDRKCR